MSKVELDYISVSNKSVQELPTTTLFEIRKAYGVEYCVRVKNIVYYIPFLQELVLQAELNKRIIEIERKGFAVVQIYPGVYKLFANKKELKCYQKMKDIVKTIENF